MEMPASKGTSVSSPSIWPFLVLVGALSWPIWVASGVLPRAGTGAYDGRWLVAQVGVFGPSLAALLVSASLSRELRRNSLRLLPVVLVPLIAPGLLVARASPSAVIELPPLPAIATVAVAILVIARFVPLGGRLLGPTSGEPQTRPARKWAFLSVALLPALFLLAWVLATARHGELRISALEGGPLRSAWTLLVCFAHNLLLGGSLGEEIGWRGFLLPVLLRRMRPLGASAVVGVVCGLWHLPVDIYAGGGVAGAGAVLARVAFSLPLAVVFTWFYLGSRGSLLIALLLHTSLNVMGDLGLSSYRTTELAFFFLLCAAALVVSVASPVMRGDHARGSP